MKIERLGVPSVGIVMPNFEKLARSEAAMLGLPDLGIVVPTKAGVGDTLVDAEQIRILTEAIVPALVNLLTEAS